MLMDRVASSRNDEYYTPAYAVEPILSYIRPGSVVWCPFDTEESMFVRLIREQGCKVTATHIGTGQDFFTTAPPDGCEYIVSNPPYSCKGQVLSRLFDLGVPFAMLVGIAGLFESQTRFKMFRDNDFEIMFLSKRVAYFKDYGDQRPSLNPPFSSAYVCHHVLPKQICFAELNK